MNRVYAQVSLHADLFNADHPGAPSTITSVYFGVGDTRAAGRAAVFALGAHFRYHHFVAISWL